MSVIEATRRTEWLEDRRTHITGTDIAAILGLSHFRTPLDVWLEKRNEGVEQEVTEPMRWGSRLERGILQGYQEETGIPLTFADSFNLLTAPDMPLIGATLDARHTGGDMRPVDAKNIGRADATEWGDPESDEIPVYYGLQLHMQMIVTQSEIADLAALFWGSKFQRYTVHADAEIADTIRTEAQAWWARHIINGECPPITGSKSAGDYLARKFSKHNELILPSDSEIDLLATDLRGFREEIAIQEAAEAYAVNQLKERIGEATGFVGDWGKITWKKTKDGTKTDWEALARKFHPTAEQIAAHTQPKPGSRRFLATFKDGK